MGKKKGGAAKKTANQSANQSSGSSASQPTSSPVNQPANQPSNPPANVWASRSANQPIGQSINQPISQPANQSTAQPATAWINRSASQPANQSVASQPSGVWGNRSANQSVASQPTGVWGNRCANQPANQSAISQPSGVWGNRSASQPTHQSTNQSASQLVRQPVQQGATREGKPTPSNQTTASEPFSGDRAGRTERLSENANSADGSSAGTKSKEESTRKHVSEIETKPKHITSKKGTSGTPVKLQANYFKLLSETDWCLYQYRVDIAPNEERTIVRKALLRTHRNDLGPYIFDGSVLYTSNPLPQPLEFNSIRTEDRQPMNIKIRLVGDLVRGDYHYFQFFNLIVRKCLEHLQLQLVGRNYYDAESKIEVRDYRLELWPGYITSIRQHDSGIMMCAEISHKIMRNQTLLDVLADCFQRNRQNYQKMFQSSVIGCVVLTDYNNRTYRVDDVDFSSTPTKTFKLRDGTEISYATYYKQKYQITIRDLKQPLIVSRSKARDRRAGVDELIYLIPELCRSTGLTDEMRNNFHLMKAMSEHTRIGPSGRIDRLMRLNQRLMSKPEIIQEFRQWNFNLERQLVNLPGRLLQSQSIYYRGGIHKQPKQPCDWNFDIQEMPLVTAASLKDWAVVVPKRLYDQTKTFIQAVIASAQKIQMTINIPKVHTIADDRTDTFMTSISKITDSTNPQLVFCVVTNNNAQRYSAIKQKLCIDRPIPSQVLLARTLTQKSNTMMNAVSCKVAVQMNCKLGGVPWSIDLGKLLSGLMVVGFDVCHNKSSQGGDFGAVVASLDANYGRYYSAVSRHTNGEELSNDISLHLGHAVEEYRKVNSKLPSRIIIYRDGVGEGQLPFVYEYEVNHIKKKLKMIYEKSGEELKLGFIVVTKRINTRLFHNKQNPAPGTVVDDVITDPLKFDFFIVSQNVKQGTVAPTAYNVIEDSLAFTPDRIQLITFKLCHMYYNFSGTVRVPAPCQYAHKLAFFVSQYLHQPAHPKFNDLLYFL